MKFLKHGFKMSLLHPLKIQYMNMNNDNTHTTFLFNRRWQFFGLFKSYKNDYFIVTNINSYFYSSMSIYYIWSSFKTIIHSINLRVHYLYFIDGKTEGKKKVKELGLLNTYYKISHNNTVCYKRHKTCSKWPLIIENYF